MIMINRHDQILIRASAFLGMAIITLAGIMMFIYPKTGDLPEGYRSAVLAFEFATEEADLMFMTGTEENARQNRSDMNRGQNVDMLFPFAYGGLILFLLLNLTRMGLLVPKIGILFAIAIIPADLWENLVMFSITARLDEGLPAADLLPRLNVATWLKWWAISLAAFCLSVGYFQKKKILNGVISLLASGGIAIAWISGANPPVVEGMVLMLSVFFGYFSFLSIYRYWRWKKTGIVQIR